MSKKLSGSILYILISILVISLYLDRHQSFERVQTSITDIMERVKGRQAVANDIVIINYAGIKKPENFPDYAGLARLIDTVSAFRPRTIVLDDNLEMDSTRAAMASVDSLASSIKRAGNVILSYRYTETDKFSNASNFPDVFGRSVYGNVDNIFKLSSNPPVSAFSIYGPPVKLADMSERIGFGNIRPEIDQIIRWQPLVVGYRGQFFPSIHMAAAVSFLGMSQLDMRFQVGDGIGIGGRRIPTDAQGKMNINFYGPSGTFKRYSSDDINNNRIYRNELSGKLVIIAIDKERSQVMYPNPLKSSLFKAEVDANIIENIVHNTCLREASGRYNINFLILVAIGLFCIFVMPLVSLPKKLIFLSAILAALFAASYFLFSYRNLVLMVFYPAIQLIFVSIAAFAGGLSKEEAVDDEPEEEIDYESLLSSSQTISIPTGPAQVNPIKIGTRSSPSPQVHAKSSISPKAGTARGRSAVAVAEAPSEQYFGRYKVLEPIGRGAMGMVYKGLDPAIDRPVALKTIRLDQVAEGEDVSELKLRLTIEAKAAGKLSHPNIVTIYDVGDDGQQQYIAMEYLQGDTLESLLKKGLDWDYRTLSKVMIQACEGLDYAHENGIIHRDIKPANIMILPGNKVKVMDFGIARFDKSASLTQTGTALGTPNYISPEQLRSQPVDRRSDIFSLGVVFYEVLTGEKPFKGDTISALIYSILHTEPPRPSELNLDIPRIFDKIVAKAMVKDSDIRFQRAREIADILKKLI